MRVSHRLLSLLVAIAAAVLAFAAPVNAQGTQMQVAPGCFAHSSQSRATSEMIDASPRWVCTGEEGWDATAPVSWIRFDLSAVSVEGAPRIFHTRNSRFKAIEITAVDTDGTARSVNYFEADGQPIPAGPIFTLDLPEILPQTQAVVVKIVAPHNAPMVTEARLAPSAEEAGWTLRELIMIAVILGMLVTPLIFDINFYIVLRERFVLYHAGMVTAMIVYVMFASGLMAMFKPISVPVMAVGGALTWAVGIALSAFFLRAFLERNALPKMFRRALYISGWWTLIVVGFASLQLHATQSFDNQLYFLAFIPVIAIYVASLVVALRNGSRAARFVAIAWIPLIIAAIDRLLRGIGAYIGPSELDQALYVGLAMEVVLVALGIADKYLAIRHQRDRAWAAAREFENISARDPLTGLLNRRGIDNRFDRLREQGYESFALFDLDHFKLVNDTYGHETGDAVLRVVANVLQSDPEAVAFRMGGEEFLIILRGDDTEIRAERLRQMIPVKVAREVDALSTVLTASVGLVHARRDAFPDLAFPTIYRRADLLLYEAKEGGRNLLASETIRPELDDDLEADMPTTRDAA